MLPPILSSDLGCYIPVTNFSTPHGYNQVDGFYTGGVTSDDRKSTDVFFYTKESNMKTSIIILSLLVLTTVVWPLVAQEAEKPLVEMPKPAPAAQRPRIQIALLLDTSSSMSGLIAQAKTQLWKIVNEFTSARRNGLAPLLEVALYQYGNSGLTAEGFWIQQVLPLTDNLDLVSEKLFALRTNGGTELCGQVIHRASGDLKWSDNPKDMKVIFIAGNEPFSQMHGQSVSYVDACKGAIQKSITINTIHCGNEAVGVNTKWKDGALLADGTYSFIDHNSVVPSIPAPQDADIAKLGAELNKTYIPYGAKGKKSWARQTKQDANSAGSSIGANVQRQVTKANSYYRNDSWDLVDALTNKKVKLEEIKEEDLPENMKKMTIEDRQKFVDENLAQRKKLQGTINDLNKARRKFVDEEMKKRGTDNTLQKAMIHSLRGQAEKLDIKFAE